MSVPFIDDFSYDSNVPDTILWKDNSVFVKKLGVNPITIGVVTFDGLNSFGRPYDLSLTGTDSEHADTLTSRKIDLSDVEMLFYVFLSNTRIGK